MTDQQKDQIARLEMKVSRLRLVVEAQRAMKAKLYPERPLAKVLAFKPRSA